MKNILLLILCILNFTATAQLTWSEDIAQIFYDNCTSCHNPNGIAPFPLVDYQEVVTSYGIKSSINSKSMPPWSADNDYVEYASARVLTTAEIDAISEWIDNGSPEGDPNLTPPKPVYNKLGYIQDTPDLTVQIPTYSSKATEEGDDYVCFTIPSGLTKTRVIKAVEVIPGNLEIVHHALIFIDADQATQTDTIGGDCASPDAGTLVTAYVPGSTPAIFPSNENFNSGMTIEAGSDVIVAMHFPEGSFGKIDSTKVNFYFYDEGTEVREVFAADLLQNWDFHLPANKITDVEASYPENNSGIDADITVMSVFPHMHLLGQSIQSFGISPTKDTIPFVKIDEWDFEWQDFYFFKNPKKLPKGSYVYGEGVFDNTSNNPNNPTNPPINVYPGLNTKDEMFLFYFHYMLFQEGDEEIDTDSLNNIFLPTVSVKDESVFKIKVTPNPTRNSSNISYYLPNPAFVSIYIYDINGMLVEKIIRERQQKGNQMVSWNSKDNPSGVYFYSMMINGKQKMGRLLKL